MTNKKTKKKEIRVQIKDVNGVSRNLILPQGTSKAARAIFKEKCQRLVKFQKGNIELSTSDINWVNHQSDLIRKKLDRLGIKFHKRENQDRCQLENITKEFIETKKQCSETTLIKYEAAAERLIRKFGKTKDIRDFEITDAATFSRWLVEHEKLDANSTARRTCGYASSFFVYAQKLKLIEDNPFLDIAKNVKANKQRHFYISPDIATKLYQQINTPNDQLRFVLMYFLGLRCPSELNELCWNDFDFEEGMVEIRAKKLAYLDDDKHIRHCPFNFPEALPVIKKHYEARTSDNEKILPHLTNENLRARVEKWCGKAGIDLWPDLLTNFRRTAITNACDLWPSHVVAAYFGHSEKISKKFYRMVTDHHSLKALDMPEMLGGEL